MNLLDPLSLVVGKGESGTLVVRLADGSSHVDVGFVRLFPHSEPSRYISVRRKQGPEFIEIGIIKDLLECKAEDRELILEDIRMRYFIPGIIDIVSIETRRGKDVWAVVTDRGTKTFVVVERMENVVTTGAGVIIVTDAEKCRYAISDLTSLSPKSQMLLHTILP